MHGVNDEHAQTSKTVHIQEKETQTSIMHIMKYIYTTKVPLCNVIIMLQDSKVFHPQLHEYTLVQTMQ